MKIGMTKPPQKTKAPGLGLSRGRPLNSPPPKSAQHHSTLRSPRAVWHERGAE